MLKTHLSLDTSSSHYHPLGCYSFRANDRKIGPYQPQAFLRNLANATSKHSLLPVDIGQRHLEHGNHKSVGRISSCWEIFPFLVVDRGPTPARDRDEWRGYAGAKSLSTNIGILPTLIT